MLATSALSHQDGSVSVLAAGIQQVDAPSLPAFVQLAVVARLALEPEETEGISSHVIEVFDPVGERRADVSSLLTHEWQPQEADERPTITSIANLSLVLDQPGWWTVRYLVQGTDETLKFRVTVRPNPQVA